MAFGTAFSLGLVALVAFLAGPIGHFIRITGIFLTPNPTILAEGQVPLYIEDTTHCEDLHHYRPANLLFTACEDDRNTRFKWFPPLGSFVPVSAQGSIHVIDPRTLKSTRLSFEDFKGPFITHGIDVIEDPERPDAVYIFAVNHIPNPDYTASEKPKGINKSNSQIELFHHVLDSGSARHIRSINHPLIKTPNDIYAESPVSFYVTNDHFYRDGPMRLVEDVWRKATWSDIIHVQIADLSKDGPIDVSVALTGLFNNNGLGHGRTEKEIVISSAMGGELYLGTLEGNRSISVHTTVSFDTLTDNPSYYEDPYGAEGYDASGFVVAGISQAVKAVSQATDPDATAAVQVWYMGLNKGTGVWEKRLLFEDDGSRIRSASAAVLIPVENEGGRKLARLFVTGFMSERILVVPVEL
ncbi:uncharacterized protein N7515_008503 [Penicillium bovifimosum]|uniref:Serum paraoxonase/arylesterase family protein n=1 Tax=Penicillium bovifimosum TaxID=126998 RepID=A0A9W9GNE6_9EURO|nr:uncharacterized protein N7515_008503 [Penicillium bovifimosum]KAJ5124678.1 hypothetical protein N7515_008503 [Penicillium bovifimosum]